MFRSLKTPTLAYWAKDKSGIIYCVNARTGEVVYERRLQPSAKEIYATPLLANGRLYYVSRENGIFVVAATPDFVVLAHTQLEGDGSLFAASPVPLAGGAVLLRSDRFLVSDETLEVILRVHELGRHEYRMSAMAGFLTEPLWLTAGLPPVLETHGHGCGGVRDPRRTLSSCLVCYAF